jgi:regulator of protease activity HflC (stomatin/prohibitin superfamily)
MTEVVSSPPPAPPRDRSFWFDRDNDLPRFGNIALVVVGAFLLLWLLLRSTVMVGTGQIAVMTRFGRVTGQEVGEGFHVINPLDTPNKYDVKVQKEQQEAAAASKDLQDVRATLVLNYALAPGKVSEMHQRVGVNYKEKLIDPAIQEVFKASSAHYNATHLITLRPEVKARAADLLRARLDNYDIRVVDLSITNFAFSQDFTNAIEAKQVAQQEAERARFNLERARLDAQAQQLQAASLSEFYLRKLFLEKWNGVLPEVLGGEFAFLKELSK